MFYDEQGYLNLLEDTMKNGEYRKTRNGYVYSQFGNMIVFNNVSKCFPLITTKKMFLIGIIEELLWFLKGSTNAKELQKKGVHIWDGNSTREYLDSIGLTHYEENELGPIYGWQWRRFGETYAKDKNHIEGVDQIRYILEELIKTDNSRRAVLTSWNPQQLKEMALPPCHIMYSFYKDKNGLSCLMNMRSSDLFLGLPFNIASTALLTSIIAKVLHMNVNKIAITMTDSHLYEEHLECVKEQIKNTIHEPPTLNILKAPPDISSSIEEKLKWIDSLVFSDFEIINYKCGKPLKAPMK